MAPKAREVIYIGCLMIAFAYIAIFGNAMAEAGTLSVEATEIFELPFRATIVILMVAMASWTIDFIWSFKHPDKSFYTGVWEVIN